MTGELIERLDERGIAERETALAGDLVGALHRRSFRVTCDCGRRFEWPGLLERHIDSTDCPAVWRRT